MQRIMKSPKRLPLDPNELNFGVRLYQKGVKTQEEKERMCKETKEKQEKSILDAYVFKP